MPSKASNLSSKEGKKLNYITEKASEI